MKKINMIERLFSSQQRHLYMVQKQVKSILSYQEPMRALRDEQLQAKTTEFKNRLRKGESLESLLPEAYAVVRESARRVLGLYPFEVQLMGAVILHYGDIAEMKTGEGKTLTSTMPIYLNALTGMGVHVVTTNDYLASRDAQEMGQIYSFLGLQVGYNHRGLFPQMKQMEFAKDITYTTNSELGFDFLRDGMAMHRSQRVLRGLSFALIDEVDSILIDEARTPLIISGNSHEENSMFEQADHFVKQLSRQDYEHDLKDKVVFLSAAGIQKAETYFNLKNLYHPDHMTTVHFISQALKANVIMKRDVDYVVKEEEVLIVDEFTGRAMEGRNYSQGLHQAIEAKEGIAIKQESQTLATITYQNFFRLYHKLAGMSGTAKTDEIELLETYNMRVFAIETNQKVIRRDEKDAIFATKNEKYEACVQDVMQRHQKGQPVLIGTAYISDSELMSKLLSKARIPHQVLNAKQHAQEADVIAQAGQKGAVTIATNMAGRGTDIKLGDGVAAIGGLAVLGLQRHEAKRIDHQLIGRSGRQGDPGYSRFYVALDDELVLRNTSPSDLQAMKKMIKDLARLHKEIDRLQRTVESDHYYTRKQLLEYDDVLREQRSVISQQRDLIMESESPIDLIHLMVEEVVSDTVNQNKLQFRDANDTDVVCRLLNKYGGPVFEAAHLKNLNRSEMIDTLSMTLANFYESKTAVVRDEIAEYERNLILRSLDEAWISHVDAMMDLKKGIHLRSYAQKKPVEAYQEEGYARFKEMLQQVASTVVHRCMVLEVA